MSISEKTENTEITSKEPKKEEFHSEKFPCLVMVEGDFLGEVYPINKSVVLIGRGDDADITISDTSISRRHSKIERIEDEYVLVDLGSTNGLFLNGKKIKEKTLKDGDKIKMGRVVLRFGFQDSLDKDYHERLRSMAIRDGLTKIYNKRHFMEVLAREFSFSNRNDVELSLVVFDIDDFKKINDTYGHTVGDQVLKTISQLLDKEVRGYDIFARYGGEEFVFLLRGISSKNTQTFAERIRRIIDTYPFVINDQRVKVTISVGFSVTNPFMKFKKMEDFIADADKYLYKSKREGKNRISFPDEANIETTQPTKKK
jgi:two-component system, cell cycle response regulator